MVIEITTDQDNEKQEKVLAIFDVNKDETITLDEFEHAINTFEVSGNPLETGSRLSDVAKVLKDNICIVDIALEKAYKAIWKKEEGTLSPTEKNIARLYEYVCGEY